MGDGQSLFVSDQELLCEWTTGATTRSKNVDSLPLDQIIYMNVLLRSKPVLLVLIAGLLALPLVVEVLNRFVI